jgi:hypothetical protein
MTIERPMFPPVDPMRRKTDRTASSPLKIVAAGEATECFNQVAVVMRAEALSRKEGQALAYFNPHWPNLNLAAGLFWT